MCSFLGASVGGNRKAVLRNQRDPEGQRCQNMEVRHGAEDREKWSERAAQGVEATVSREQQDVKGWRGTEEEEAGQEEEQGNRTSRLKKRIRSSEDSSFMTVLTAETRHLSKASQGEEDLFWLCCP